MKTFIEKQSFDYEMIALCWHEAGHTIAGLLNYAKITNVCFSNITKPGGPDGDTYYAMYNGGIVEDQDLARVLLIFELQIVYAGLIAEKTYYKNICGSDRFPAHLKSGSRGDIEEGSNIIRRNKIIKSGRQTFLFKKQIQKDVELLLKEYWDAVSIIARALYQKKRLSYSELKSLLTRKTKDKEFWKSHFKKIDIIHNDKRPIAEYIVKEMLMEDAIFSI
jgi:hypothetical protein